MADVHGTKGLGGIAPKIAIGAAVVALLTSLAAVIVVTSRGGGGGGGAAPAAASSSSARDDGGKASGPPMPSARRVAAADVVRLRREVVTLAREAGKVLGVKVIDDDVRKALDLGADDVIAAIAGRAIERELDVFEAMFALKRLRPSTVYLELLRDGQPVLVRWTVDGDLQTARAPDRYDPRGSLGSLGGGGLGGLGGLGGGGLAGGYGIIGTDPDPRDPLVDTIEKLDELRYAVPRATVARVCASPSRHAGAARTLPVRRAMGFRVYGIRPSSIAAAIGILNGDTIRAINGNGVSSIDEVMELYPQIKDASEWRIDLDRRGKPMLITLAIK